jgi:hypothetical protein
MAWKTVRIQIVPVLWWVAMTAQYFKPALHKKQLQALGLASRMPPVKATRPALPHFTRNEQFSKLIAEAECEEAAAGVD